MPTIEKKTAGTFIYGVGSIEVEISQVGEKKWLNEMELFITQGSNSFQLIAMNKPELKNPLFLQRTIQAFINHLQMGGEEQSSGRIRQHFRNWLYKQNGSLINIINGTKMGDAEEDRTTGRNSLKDELASRYFRREETGN